MIIFSKLSCSLSWGACNSKALSCQSCSRELCLHVEEELNKSQSFPKNHQHMQVWYVVFTWLDKI